MSRCQGLTTYERLIISRPNFESAQDNNHVRETDQLSGYNQAWESERTGSRASQDIRNIHEVPDVLGERPNVACAAFTVWLFPAHSPVFYLGPSVFVRSQFSGTF